MICVYAVSFFSGHHSVGAVFREYIMESDAPGRRHYLCLRGVENPIKRTGGYGSYIRRVA